MPRSCCRLPPLEWHGARVKRLECVGMGLGDEDESWGESRREQKWEQGNGNEHKADAVCVCVLWIEESATWHLEVECECELAQATRGNTIHIFYLCLYACVCVWMCVHSVQEKECESLIWHMACILRMSQVLKLAERTGKKNTHTRWDEERLQKCSGKLH